jgi:hypothetical protein
VIIKTRRGLKKNKNGNTAAITEKKITATQDKMIHKSKYH